MIFLSALNALICLAIALRLLAFQRQGYTHRPFASMAAYTLIVAAGAVVIDTLFGQTQWLIVPQMLLNLALLAAVFCVKGNVVDLFRSGEQRSNRITEFLRGESWKI